MSTVNQQILYSLCLTGIVSTLIVPSASAEVVQTKSGVLQNITHRELRKRLVNQAELLSQVPNSPTLVEVTGVKATPTDKGVELILQTNQGEELQITNRSADNNFIADIANAQLRLPNSDGFIFRSEKPIEGITEITVTNLDANTIRVTVIGEAGLPTAELFDSDEGLIFGLTPVVTSAQTPKLPEEPETQTEQPSTPDQPIELVVTGQQDRYSVPNATTATRTDTPLRDIPQSIQAVPRQVLEDRQVIRASDALRSVSGVQQGNKVGGTSEVFNIRGFPQFGGNLRDGFNNRNNFSIVETANLERIEVLKGPASVLYGNLDPGGVINFVTKQPLSEPFYAAGLQVGSFGLVRPTLDLSGPLNPERTLLYRLNAAYERGGNFRNFDTEVERFFISPVVTWKIGDRTDLRLELEYSNDKRPYDRGLVAFGTGIADIPFDRVLGEPDDFSERTNFLAGYRLEHRFNDDWKLRNQFRYSSSDQTNNRLEPGRLNETTGELRREFSLGEFTVRNYELQTDLVGNFATGSIQHTLLFGVDLSWVNDGGVSLFEPAPSINIFNPVYGIATRPSRDEFADVFPFGSQTDSIGVFVQNQITLAENLKLLVGGRFDNIDQSSASDERQDQAFSPRVGIVYQPIEPISLYTSFSRSFQPNFGNRADGSLLEPVRGTQYEVGVRGEFLNGSLITNLAAYEITRSNLAVTDPDNPNFSIPSGEQRSRGVELDVTGQILPGWNLIASYAYTDARVTKDDNLQPGNLLDGVPFNSASLWSTYEIQTGDFQGLGFGLGLFYVGERQGDLNNSFQLPSYVRTDASIFYRRNNWRAGININNLFNVDYIEDSGQRRNRINPGEPFTVRGTVSVEF
ncbi:TonB-dependent siderophore receptor [Anabaena sp. FACHB-709]|uniref:TonB-dependent receptor n=1 Tax=Anabaena cylindrica FACHB-318 TaxID=2692880 RepID=A0ABR7ZAT4_ANACY|nr:TonB-dependent receptor [Anabaena cylindrica FACHB-318]MBD2261891.1 TonB-dependent receptor [Anabaena sp. FACHB-709]MBD2271476.1 TonB-dependent receptor [Nostoc sp. PCC 7120 = FACHB-418]MBD2282254.1 TonB-dependent receptor [Anabaena cylindrica FACHB-170]MBD2348366.1 TonB-dependent receptor [Trichormus variabilis FACHB-171]HBW29964.1 TonB-dependent receptor [Nostoc sp. UBA8866]